MHRTHAAFPAHPGGTSTIGDADLLPRQPIFRTRDLEHAREYLGGVLVEARFAYLSQERHLDFRHRQAKLGPIAVNSMQYGPGIMVTAPPFGDFYLLQFTLTDQSNALRRACGRTGLAHDARRERANNPSSPARRVSRSRRPGSNWAAQSSSMTDAVASAKPKFTGHGA
jgi:AraC-binding-like domain